MCLACLVLWPFLRAKKEKKQMNDELKEQHECEIMNMCVCVYEISIIIWLSWCHRHATRTRRRLYIWQTRRIVSSMPSQVNNSLIVLLCDRSGDNFASGHNLYILNVRNDETKHYPSIVGQHCLSHSRTHTHTLFRFA